MEDVVVNVVFFGALIGLIFLGKWTYQKPDRFMHVFNPYLEPYSKTTLKSVRFVGGAWCIGGLLGCLSVIVQNIIALLGRAKG